jgi:hypothetical protein
VSGIIVARLFRGGDFLEGEKPRLQRGELQQNY